MNIYGVIRFIKLDVHFAFKQAALAVFEIVIIFECGGCWQFWQS